MSLALRCSTLCMDDTMHLSSFLHTALIDLHQKSTPHPSARSRVRPILHPLCLLSFRQNYYASLFPAAVPAQPATAICRSLSGRITVRSSIESLMTKLARPRPTQVQQAESLLELSVPKLSWQSKVPRVPTVPRETTMQLQPSPRLSLLLHLPSSSSFDQPPRILPL